MWNQQLKFSNGFKDTLQRLVCSWEQVDRLYVLATHGGKQRPWLEVWDNARQALQMANLSTDNTSVAQYESKNASTYTYNLYRAWVEHEALRRYHCCLSMWRLVLGNERGLPQWSFLDTLASTDTYLLAARLAKALIFRGFDACHWLFCAHIRALNPRRQTAGGKQATIPWYADKLPTSFPLDNGMEAVGIKEYTHIGDVYRFLRSTKDVFYGIRGAAERTARNGHGTAYLSMETLFEGFSRKFGKTPPMLGSHAPFYHRGRVGKFMHFLIWHLVTERPVAGPLEIDQYPMAVAICPKVTHQQKRQRRELDPHSADFALITAALE